MAKWHTIQTLLPPDLLGVLLQAIRLHLSRAVTVIQQQSP
jgi:hypothetical protein